MDTKEMQEKLVVFTDAIGRLLIGELVADRCNVEDFVVKNPTVVHVEPKEGNISIQFFPIFFKEFLGAKDEGCIFTYKRKNIAPADKMVLDFKLYAQYTNMYYGQGPIVKSPNLPQANSQMAPIKLFS